MFQKRWWYNEFDKDNININPGKIQQIHKYINEIDQICTIDHEKKKLVAEDSNLSLVNQMHWTILKSNTICKRMVDNPTHTEINSQLNVNANTIKIDLSFLEGPKKVVIIT